jgi:hypothetical protein
MQYELDMPKVYPSLSSFSMPVGSATLPIVPNNAANPYFGAPYNGNSPSQKGLLFMYTHGKTGQESSQVTVTP